MQKLRTVLFCCFSFSMFLVSCVSLEYVTGLYEQSPGQRVDVVVRVKDNKGIAFTDLALNDFYVRHNNQPLERKNKLHLDETLSAVKLYMVVLVDQRENPELKNSFRRTREALKAYLTLQPHNMYIKLISYDTEARALNTEFSNDKKALQALLQQLNTVQTNESGLKQALALAQENLDSLPNGPRALNPKLFQVAAVHGAKSSLLYNSAILLMNHNTIAVETLRPYTKKYNFVALDATGELHQAIKPLAAGRAATSQTNDKDDLGDKNSDNLGNILEAYELPPGYLNKDIDQTRAVKLVNRAWDSLNNLVNGYYWLTYNKYTDFNRPEPNAVTVSLTQYGRSKDVGSLIAYVNTETVTEDADEDSLADILNTAETLDAMVPDELLPPAIIKTNTKSSPVEYDSLLALLPGQYQDVYDSSLQANAALAAASPVPMPDYLVETHYPTNTEPIVDDFEILSKLGTSKTDGDLLSLRDSAVPQYTAEPITLISAESAHQIAEKAPKKIQNAGNTTGGRHIQVGAFVKLENLYDVIERLSGDYNVQAVTSTVNGKEYNRCIIGPFDNSNETRRMLEHLKTNGNLRDAFIIRKPIAEWIGK
ncbi:SPOR domain-containing protein [Candidatus Haliotispira prima]|uniref:SPOR domain-containing protein n=1 Tax=Candidatus Haliotispira prima TaxID=3034016 RepID=A0ABY8MKC3_9SPIO|nr:SPOR domain-containing protein [Candidatus Haliotispira prima]